MESHSIDSDSSAVSGSTLSITVSTNTTGTFTNPGILVITNYVSSGPTSYSKMFWNCRILFFVNGADNEKFIFAATWTILSTDFTNYMLGYKCEEHELNRKPIVFDAYYNATK